MKNRIIQFLLPLLILSLGAGGFLYLRVTKPVAQAATPVERSWTVAVETLTPGTLHPSLTLYGRVETPRDATLAAAVTADVLAVPSREGQRVEQGELLVRLDDREARLALEQREAELGEIEADLETERNRVASNRATLRHEQELLALMQRAVKRLRTLKNSRVASESAIDEAEQTVQRQMISIETRRLDILDHQAREKRIQARLTRARALRDSAALDLERTLVQAPFAGRIAQVAVAPGDRVRAGDHLLDLYDDTALEVRAELPSRYEDLLSRARRRGVPIQGAATRGKLRIGLTLNRLSAKVDPGRAGVDALLHVGSEGETLRVGEFLSLTLTLPAVPNVVAVPYSALYGTDRVYKLVDGRMQPLSVERVGEWRSPTGRTRAIIASHDLAAGDLLIVTQLPNAAAGLQVKVAAPPTVAQAGPSGKPR